MTDENGIFAQDSALFKYPGFEFLDENAPPKPAAQPVAPPAPPPAAAPAATPAAAEIISAIDSAIDAPAAPSHTETQEERRERLDQKKTAEREKKRAERKAKRKEKRKQSGVRGFIVRWLTRILVLLVVALVLIALAPQIFKLFGIYDYSADVKDAVLGEARIVTKLTVLEQDVSNEVVIEGGGLLGWLLGQNLAGVRKTITFHATGYFVVDFASFAENNITVNSELKTVIITIPYPVLDHTQFRVEDTEMTQTELGVFSLGEVRLTEEQHRNLESMALVSMNTELNSEEVVLLANEAAIEQVYKLFEPLVNAVSSEYTLTVAFVAPEVPAAE